MYNFHLNEKSIIKKIQIGLNTIFVIEMKIIHICNFLTINFYENLNEYFCSESVFNHKRL